MKLRLCIKKKFIQDNKNIPEIRTRNTVQIDTQCQRKLVVLGCFKIHQIVDYICHASVKLRDNYSRQKQTVRRVMYPALSGK